MSQNNDILQVIENNEKFDLKNIVYWVSESDQL
jgi:hypothetical protein